MGECLINPKDYSAKKKKPQGFRCKYISFLLFQPSSWWVPLVLLVPTSYKAGLQEVLEFYIICGRLCIGPPLPLQNCIIEIFSNGSLGIHITWFGCIIVNFFVISMFVAADSNGSQRHCSCIHAFSCTKCLRV